MSAQESADQQHPSIHDPFSTEDDTIMDTPDSPPDLYTHSQSFSDTPATTPSKSMNIATPHEKINHGAPGSSWTSKKFREEYDRIWDGLVHREWDGKTKYGDPLLKN